MAGLNNSVSIRLGVEGAQGVNDAVREIGRNVRTTMDDAGKATDEAGRKFDALARRLDPVAAAAARLSNAQAVADRAVASGARTAEDAARLMEAAQSRYNGVVEKTTDVVALNRNQMAETVHVVKAFADSVAAGADPMRALAMEGGRIGQIFSMGAGGVGGTLRAFGSTLGPYVLNPITLTIGALAAAGLAAYQFTQQQHEIEKSLLGVGRAAGVSADGLRAAAVAGAQRGNITAGQGIDLATQFAATGKISGAIMPDLIGTTASFARKFGIDLGDAGKELAAAFADPASGADKLNERLGFLDAKTRETIRTFQAQGDTFAAQRTLLNAFSEDVAKAADKTGVFARAWQAVKGVWGDVEQGVGARFAPSTQQKIDALEEQQRQLREQPRGYFSRNPRDDGRIEDEMARLRAQRIEEQLKAEAEKARLEASARSIRADDLVRQLTPELGERQGLVNRKKLLSDALGDPEVVKKLGVAAEDAQGALSRVTAQLANWKSPLQRLVQDGELSVRAIEAQTFGQKAAVASEQARLAVLRESGDQLRAAAAAENARNELIAQGNRKGDDMLRDAKRSVELAGLDPKQRAFRQIEFERDDFKRQYAPTAGDLTSTPFAPIAAASVRLSQSFDGVAAAASRASNALATGSGIGPNSALPFFAQGNPTLATIMRAEGTMRDGDPYNTSLGYRKSPKPLTSMTLDEALAWGEQIARDDMEKRGVSRGEASSAKGGFQIVNSTQRGAMKALGLSGDMMFSPEIQNKMAMWILQTQGPGAWEGLKKNGGLGGDVVRPLASRAGELADQSADLRKDAFVKGQVADLVRGANQEIDAQNALLIANAESFGKTTGEVAKYRKEVELKNALARAGIELDSETAQKFADIAQRAGQAAKAQEDLARAQQMVIGAMDGVRSGSRDFLGTFISDIRKGQSASRALEDSLQKLADRLINMGLDSLISGLFGQSGRAGGGMFGGGLMSLFSGLFGGGSGAPSIGFGSFGGIYAEGGIMSALGNLPLRHYAAGGVAYSPQMSLFGEGASPEAYVPLRSGAIPVTLGGKGLLQQPQGDVHVNLIGAPPGSRVEKSTDSRGQRRIDVILDEAVARSLGSDRGALAMSSIYGAQRPTARR